jgi:hypothetical protein
MRLFLLIGTLLAWGACAKYDPQYEGPYSDTDTKTPGNTAPSYEILTLSNGTLYLYSNTFKTYKILSNLPPGIDEAAINFSHDRIAYHRLGNNIEIIDTSGVAVATVPNTEYAEWFEWHSNNQTLYYLEYGNINIYGPDIPGFEPGNYQWVMPFTPDREVNRAAVLKDGSVLVGGRYYAGFNYVNKLYLVKNGSVAQSISLPPWELVRWIRSDLEGKRVTYGLFNSIPGDCFNLDIEAWNNTLLEYIDLAAPAPEGNALVKWLNGLSITRDNGVFFTAPNNPPDVQALDW